MKSKPLKLFISYSHKDKNLYEEFKTHLKVFEISGIIDPWSDQEIVAGQVWKDEIKKALDNAEIAIFLVSSDLIASDFIQKIEIKRAIKRHKLKLQVIIPVIIRPCTFESLDLSPYQSLPKDLLPVTLWENRDAAWVNVMKGIEAAIEKIRKEASRQDKFESNFNEQKKDDNGASSKISKGLIIFSILLVIFVLVISPVFVNPFVTIDVKKDSSKEFVSDLIVENKMNSINPIKEIQKANESNDAIEQNSNDEVIRSSEKNKSKAGKEINKSIKNSKSKRKVTKAESKLTAKAENKLNQKGNKSSSLKIRGVIEDSNGNLLKNVEVFEKNNTSNNVLSNEDGVYEINLFFKDEDANKTLTYKLKGFKESYLLLHMYNTEFNVKLQKK